MNTTFQPASYVVGQRVRIAWTHSWRPLEDATVVALRKHGAAKLSNGWLADASGFLEGTKQCPGGQICQQWEAEE